ncbi:alpha/beta fold hydrolase [Actinoplanes sp. NPDC051861]|uniref:alpha/beta fold hydrolase n=1 Tax=Actinoplanes sp. NPDC051861 TaxID=3155170 RepID=UPI00343ED44A
MTVTLRTLAPGRPGAPLVVLAHGLEDTWSSWRRLAAHLDPDWRLVALDLPWRAGNDYQWGDRTAARWLAEGLDLVGARPDALIAHSYGANAALGLLSAGDPALADVVALICPLYRSPEDPVTWSMFDRARSTFEAHVRESVRARMEKRAAARDPAVMQTMMTFALDRVGPSGFLTVFQQFVASAQLPLERIGARTLVIAGTDDPTLSPRAARKLGGRIPGGRLLINDGYDHFCHIRRARDAARTIAEFVTESTTITVGDIR